MRNGDVPVPEARVVTERCEEALRYTTRMIESVRPHPSDSAEMKRGKFEFFKRLLALQVEAVKLLELYEFGETAGPEKHGNLMDKLQTAELILPEYRQDISERLYPADTEVVQFGTSKRGSKK